MIFIDEQGTVLFASRVMARLLGQEPEAMEGQPLNEWLATPLQQQWPDLASEREHNLPELGIKNGVKNELNARSKI